MSIPFTVASRRFPGGLAEYEIDRSLGSAWVSRPHLVRVIAAAGRYAVYRLTLINSGAIVAVAAVIAAQRGSYETYGGPEGLEVREVPEPHAGQGEVRVRVRAAGLNAMDGAFSSQPERAAQFGLTVAQGYASPICRM
jgi:hypothetical protein